MEFLTNHNSILYFFSTLAQLSLGVVGITIALAIFKVNHLHEILKGLWETLFNHLKDKHTQEVKERTGKAIDFAHLEGNLDSKIIIGIASEVRESCYRTELLVSNLERVENNMKEIYSHGKTIALFSFSLMAFSFFALAFSDAFDENFLIIFLIYSFLFFALLCYFMRIFVFLNKILTTEDNFDGLL